MYILLRTRIGRTSILTRNVTRDRYDGYRGVQLFTYMTKCEISTAEPVMTHQFLLTSYCTSFVNHNDQSCLLKLCITIRLSVTEKNRRNQFPKHSARVFGRTSNVSSSVAKCLYLKMITTGTPLSSVYLPALPGATG